MDKRYNPKSYWENRLEKNFNLNGVGFPHFGKSYNEWLYKMRKKVLERFISKYKINVPNMRILDVGCGTGFYIDIWIKKGVRCLTGIDITSISVRELKNKYQTFNFYELDITSPTLINDISLYKEKFNIVTAFDILFHIVDDNKFEQAIKNLGLLCSSDGFILISDIFPQRRIYSHFHQKNRMLKYYTHILSKNGIEIIDRFPVFYLLGPPLDISNVFFQKIILYFWWERIVGNIERKTRLIGPLFFFIDSAMTRLFRESPSVEMIICQHYNDIEHCD